MVPSWALAAGESGSRGFDAGVRPPSEHSMLATSNGEAAPAAALNLVFML